MSEARGRYRRENLRGDEYAQALTYLREALKGADASAPTTAAELHELKRLIGKYPDHARTLLTAQDGPDAAAAP